MPDHRPLWRRLFDSAERAAAPPPEQLVRTGGFARAAALLAHAQASAGHSADALTARLWHLLNLPAGTDVARLRTQLGALDHEVRRLALRLEQDRHDPHLRDPAGAASAQDPRPRPEPDGPARPGAPRGRARRSARP